MPTSINKRLIKNRLRVIPGRPLMRRLRLIRTMLRLMKPELLKIAIRPHP
jgi:hypothetical protein